MLKPKYNKNSKYDISENDNNSAFKNDLPFANNLLPVGIGNSLDKALYAIPYIKFHNILDKLGYQELSTLILKGGMDRGIRYLKCRLFENKKDTEMIFVLCGVTSWIPTNEINNVSIEALASDLDIFSQHYDKWHKICNTLPISVISKICSSMGKNIFIDTIADWDVAIEYIVFMLKNKPEYTLKNMKDVYMEYLGWTIDNINMLRYNEEHEYKQYVSDSNDDINIDIIV
jgi:hypothetical protein